VENPYIVRLYHIERMVLFIREGISL